MIRREAVDKEGNQCEMVEKRENFLQTGETAGMTRLLLAWLLHVKMVEPLEAVVGAMLLGCRLFAWLLDVKLGTTALICFGWSPDPS